MSIDDASHYDTERKYYDVIIVGGGAAGCVLAARLSEDPKRRVLLLESGGADTDPAISAPHGAFAVQSGAFNWSDLVDPAYLTDEADASRLIEGGGGHWIPNCGFTGYGACTSQTRRSCRTSCVAIRTPRPS